MPCNVNNNCYPGAKFDIDVEFNQTKTGRQVAEINTQNLERRDDLWVTIAVKDKDGDWDTLFVDELVKHGCGEETFKVPLGDKCGANGYAEGTDYRVTLRYENDCKPGQFSVADVMRGKLLDC